MNLTLSLPILVGLSSALAMGAASAQPATAASGPQSHASAPRLAASMTPAERVQARQAHMRELLDRELAELKPKLTLSAAQEAAWTIWVTALRASLPVPVTVDWAALTVPQRVERMRTLRAERVGAMDKRADATLIFYNTLNARQKQVFDAEGGERFVHMGGMGIGGGLGKGHGHAASAAGHAASAPGHAASAPGHAASAAGHAASAPGPAASARGRSGS